MIIYYFLGILKSLGFQPLRITKEFGVLIALTPVLPSYRTSPLPLSSLKLLHAHLKPDSHLLLIAHLVLLITLSCSSIALSSYVIRVRLKNLSNWCMCLCACLVVQLCPILCDPLDCSLPGPSVHGISQARILEQAAMSFSSNLPNPGVEPCLLHCRWILYH